MVCPSHSQYFSVTVEGHTRVSDWLHGPYRLLRGPSGCHQLVASTVRPTRAVAPGCVRFGYVDHTGWHRLVLWLQKKRGEQWPTTGAGAGRAGRPREEDGASV
jgi:hypothetical protein